MSQYREIVERQAVWSNKTFGTELERGPEGPLKHILKEIVTELLGHSVDMRVRDVIAAPPRVGMALYEFEEYADLELLLMDAVRRATVKYENSRGRNPSPALVAAEHLRRVSEKLTRNENREWPPMTNTPGNAMPTEHVREQAECPICYQRNIELDSAGRLVAHSQAGFRCPGSGGTP